MAGGLLSFKQWAWQEGYEDHIEGEALQEAEAEYEKYVKESTLPKDEKNMPQTMSKKEKKLRHIITKNITGEEKKMKGTCTNCERTDKWLAPLNPPICGTCQKAAAGLKGDERVAALREIKEKILSGGLQRGPIDKKNKKKASKPERTSTGTEKADGVIGQIIEQYDAALDKAQRMMNVLVALKEDLQAKFEMPKRHIVG